MKNRILLIAIFGLISIYGISQQGIDTIASLPSTAKEHPVPFCRVPYYTDTTDTFNNGVSTKIIFSPERLPAFPGGESALQSFTAEHWNEQKKDRRLFSGQTVRVCFVVDSVGRVQNATVLKSQNEERINSIALGFISSMPAWIPGGTGAYGKAGSSNTSVIMVADVSLGFYQGKNFNTPARITLLPRPSLSVSEDFVYLSPDIFELYKVYGNIPDSIFADSIPELEGGINRYFANNIKYPVQAKEENKQGTVYVNLIVEKDGSVSNVNVIKDVYGAPVLSKESLRVIKQLPKMAPGIANGKPVRVRMTVPVRFVLM